MSSTIATSDRQGEIAVSSADLPLHCPAADAPLWARHPRVFLDVLKQETAVCPYCGAVYRFTGERPKGAH